jgi:hypothetical protein
VLQRREQVASREVAGGAEQQQGVVHEGREWEMGVGDGV